MSMNVFSLYSFLLLLLAQLNRRPNPQTLGMRTALESADIQLKELSPSLTATVPMDFFFRLLDQVEQAWPRRRAVRGNLRMRNMGPQHIIH